MPRKNWRIVIVGFVLIVPGARILFFHGIHRPNVHQSGVALMQTVGTVAGAAVGIKPGHDHHWVDR